MVTWRSLKVELQPHALLQALSGVSCPICNNITAQKSSADALCCLQSETMEHRHKKPKQTSLLQLWARAPAKQIQTVSRSSDELQVTSRRTSSVSVPLLCSPECSYAASFVTVLSLPILLLLHTWTAVCRATRARPTKKIWIQRKTQRYWQKSVYLKLLWL